MSKVLIFVSLLLVVACSHTSKELRSTSSTDSCFSLIDGFHRPLLTPLEKARAINDQAGAIKGSFAEIGAGQEVSGTFFKAKRASETIVKTISAYGKEESNRLYGDGQRFVSKGRLEAMLDVEYKAISELQDQFSEGTRTFAYANSVTTNKDAGGHGWMGIRFVPEGSNEPQTIFVHVNFNKSSVLTQHSEVGKMGVNLVHSSTVGDQHYPNRVLASLYDKVKEGVLDVDYVHFASTEMTPSHTALQMVESGMTKNVLVDESDAYVPKDMFYKKSLLIDLEDEGLSELDSIKVSQLSRVDQPLSEINEGVKVWVTKEDNLIGKLRYLDQGMGLEIFYKLKKEELNSMSESQLKSFIRSLNALRNSYKFKAPSTEGLKPEAIKLINRMGRSGLLID